MPASVDRPRPRSWWLKRFGLLAAFTLTGVALIAIGFLPAVRSFVRMPHVAVFHRTAAGWQRTSPPPNSGEMIAFSRSGTLWSCCGLQSFDGQRWRDYTSLDFGTDDSRVQAFALDGGDVWAATAHAIVHFDGKRWRKYPEAIANQDVCSIVADAGQVWALDQRGNLSHFDRNRWSVAKAQASGLDWNAEQNSDPRLALGPDGSLWLVRDAVWKAQGADWVNLTPPELAKQDVRLVGVAGGRLWLQGERLWSLSMKAQSWQSYDAGAGEAYAVTESSGIVYLAAKSGAFSFDGNQWRPLPALSSHKNWVHGVASAPDGSLWAAALVDDHDIYAAGAKPPRPNPAIFALPLIGMFLILAGFIVFRYSLRQSRFRSPKKVLQDRAIALEAAGFPPSEASAQSRAKIGAVVLFVVVIVVASRLPSRNLRVWFSLLPIGLHVASSLITAVKKRTPSPTDPIGPGAPRRIDWRGTLVAVASSLILLVVLVPDRIAKALGMPRVWAVALFPLGLLLVAVLPPILRHLAMRSFRQAKYGRALTLLDLSQLSPKPTPTRGTVMFFADRLLEAEAALRETVKAAAGPEQFRALENLGFAWIYLRRYTDAARAFEGVMKLAPENPGPLSGMAQALLERGAESTKALEWADRALSLNSQGGSEAQPERQSEMLATRAWALARLDRAREGEAALAEALGPEAPQSAPALAGVLYLAAMAMAAAQRRSAQNEYSQRAQALDPEGLYGSLSAQPGKLVFSS